MHLCAFNAFTFYVTCQMTGNGLANRQRAYPIALVGPKSVVMQISAEQVSCISCISTSLLPVQPEGVQSCRSWPSPSWPNVGLTIWLPTMVSCMTGTQNVSASAELVHICMLSQRCPTGCTCAMQILISDSHRTEWLATAQHRLFKKSPTQSSRLAPDCAVSFWAPNFMTPDPPAFAARGRAPLPAGRGRAEDRRFDSNPSSTQHLFQL